MLLIGVGRVRQGGRKAGQMFQFFFSPVFAGGEGRGSFSAQTTSAAGDRGQSGDSPETPVQGRVFLGCYVSGSDSSKKFSALLLQG